MKDTVVLGLKLFIITLIAGALLGGAYVITKEPIAEQDLKANTLARQEVLSDAATFEEMDMSAISANEKYATIVEAYIGKDASGQTVGATFKLSVTGFSAGLTYTVGVGADGTIKGVKVGSHNETPGLGAKSTEDAFQGQYSGLNADGKIEVVKNAKTGDNQIVAIAGATITSRAVTNGVNLAAECYAEFVK